jgi:TolB-like protein/DNA-binding winged helix-turn-helix (wHTH) protein/Tfp pilus assembly protein PilF
LFGPFRIDAEDRILWRDDKEVPLTRKAAETLLFLLENAGHVVEKEALLTHVWPDTFVEESTLAQNILTLRKTLGKQSNGQEYIGTVPKRGYRFEAAVAKEAEGRIFSSVTPKPEKAPVRSWWPWTVATGVVAFVLLLGVAFSLTWHRNPIQRGKIETRVRLAVLPFTNLGGDASQEYLSEGLTEEMITQLGSLNPDRLAVIARTSAMIYRNTSKDARQIGQELNVDFLLGGSVRLEGARIRVSTQLVRVSDQSTLWAANYDRDLRNILALENDVARSVASQIALRLTPEKAAFLEEPHPLDPEAYENYLEARHFWNRRTPETISKAIQLLQRAIARDPAYAQAHAALADCFVIQFIYSQTSGADALRKARAEANKALELDSSRGEPHATLASSYLYDWDFPNAEVEFQNSIRLAPRYATAHQWYAEYLSFMGREQEAITEYNRALEIDPLSSAINVEAALPYYYLGDNDRAIAQLRRTIDLDPYFASAHGHLAMALDAKGIYQEALQECLAAKALGDAPWIEITLGLVYAHLGRTADTRKVLQILKGPPTGGPASGADMLFFALGDTEGTLRGLEKEVAAHNPLLVGLAVNPQYKSLRKHPRFQEILRLIGFPEQLQYKPATGLPGS